MKKKFLLFCLLLLGAIGINAETWTPVGQVKWTEGALTGRSSDYNKTWNVSVERSDTRPSVFRLQPYASHPLGNRSDNVYVYLHTENPNQVYIEYYIYCYFYSSTSWFYHVWQRCPENGFDSRYYGKRINNTIEFPVGSFVVDDLKNTSGKQTAPSSSASYSTYIHKIEFPEGILDYQPEPETFVNIGKGQWEDCFFANSEAKEVSFERSMSRTDVFRTTPYNSEDATPVLIHTEDPTKVWIETFTASNYTFTQQCSENDVNASKYGTLTNGKIEIPSEYFNITNLSTNQTQTISGQKLVITLPEGYNTPIEDDNGIFMGIISFNDKIDNLPINVLNQYTEPMFLNFVDNMEMENATLLYYAVDQAITTLAKPEYPDNLSNAMIITFTDGLDEGSLAMAPEHLTSKNYAQYLADRIASTEIQGLPLQAYTIGLKSEDVSDDEMFEQNLVSLSSDSTKYRSVDDIEGVQEELTKIYEELSKQTSKRVISVTVPMMSHEDTYRFTLDGTVDKDKVNDSKLWIEGVFDITDVSLNNVTYHGLASASGDKITAERNGVYITFTFNDCRDEEGEILEIEKDAIDQWRYIASNDTWQHNVENDKDGKINIEDIRTSAAIMFVLDCSRSLGDLFPILKQTANSFIDRLAGGDGDVTGIDKVVAKKDNEDVDMDAPVEYYNLQGMKVTNLERGMYIRRQGNIVKKILIK